MNIKDQLQKTEQFFKRCEELRGPDAIANRIIENALNEDRQKVNEMLKNPTVRPINIKHGVSNSK